MRRAQIILTERQYAALEDDAYARRVPISEIVRALVTQHYGLEPEQVSKGRPYKSSEVAQGRRIQAGSVDAVAR